MGWGDLGRINLDNNLYDVQYGAGFTSAESNQIKNFKYINKVHSNLSKLENEAAWTKYSKLDSQVQDSLKSLYGTDMEYMVAPANGFFESARQVVGEALSNLNPLVWGGNLFEKYDKVVWAIPNAVSMAVQNDENIFDSDTWSRAFNDGETLYNNDVLKNLKVRHGQEKSFIAMKSLEGLTPGEIIAARGQLTDEFLFEIERYVNNEGDWADAILEDFKQAKLTFGRTLARSIFGPRKGKGDVDDAAFTVVSGLGDGLINIFGDPLTYFTGGIGTGFRLLGKATSKASIALDAFRTGGTKKVFKLDSVRSYWDNFGGELEKLSVARGSKNTGEAGSLVEKIQAMYPEHATEADLDVLIKNGIFNATKAEEFFEQATNAVSLLSGRTADTTYYRNSIAVSRNFRKVSSKMRIAWHKMAASGLNSKDATVAANNVFSEVKELGSRIDVLEKVDTPTLDKFKLSESKINRLAKLLSISPGDEFIIFARDNVADTLGTVKAVALQIMPKDIANAFGEAFLVANPEERLVALRGLYRGVMESMGLDKTIAGKELIEEVLKRKFGAFNEGMSVTKNLVARDSWNEGIDRFSLNGAIHSGQVTPMIGNLDWTMLLKEAGQAAFETAGKSRRGRVSVISTIGGAMNGRLSSALSDFWTFFTLGGRLGMRTAIDENFFFFMTAPREALLKVLPGRNYAKEAGKTMAAYTGNRKSVGIVSSFIRKRTPFLKNSDSFNPFDAITPQQRHKMWVDIISNPMNATLDQAQLGSLYFKAVGLEAIAVSKKLGEQASQDMLDAMLAGLSHLGSAESAVARATGANATIDNMVKVTVNEPSMLTKLHQELNVALGDFRPVSPLMLNDHQKAVVQYTNFFTRFIGSQIGYESAKKKGVNLGRIFLKHNGLPDEKSFKAAVDEVLNNLTKEEVEFFLSQRGSTVYLRGKGLSDTEIAREQLKTIFADMNVAFHGKANSFNSDLVNYFKSQDPKILTDDKAYLKFIRAFEFETFEPLASKSLFDEDVMTNIIKMEGFDGSYGAWHKMWADKAWEAMDRTVTGFTRQPAVMAYYLTTRNSLRNLELDHAQEIYASYAKNMPKAPSSLQDAIAHSDAAVRRIANISEDMSRRKFAELSMNSSIHQVLKFVDNPHIRTNISSGVRNINRFFRATEDFWRRVYRLKDVGPQALYRTRLLHAGLSGVGILEEDQFGEEYFVLPMDDILYAALDGTIRSITGNEGFTQPLFNDLTVKLTAVNPSFQDDGGIPYLSGPTAAVSVLALKAIAGQFGAPGQVLGEEMDNFLLGDLGDNLTLQKALVPAMLNRAWTIMDSNEKSQANHSAILSAIAYNQANGLGLDPNASPKERASHINNLRISGHNLVALRSFLGMISPFSVSAQESVDIPSYIKDTGVTNIRSEYFEILDTVISTYGSEISDPYEYAAAIFIGENPDKLVYTVSREDKNVKALLSRTKETQNWLLTNKGFTDSYGEAAYYFSPLGGKINLAMYQWMKAAGLYEDVETEEFLTRAQTAADKYRYFKIGERLEMELLQTPVYETRSNLIKVATYERDQLKMSNPYLEQALSGKDGFGVTKELEIVTNIQSIIEDDETPLSPQQREKIKVALTIFNRAYKYITNPSLQSMTEYTLLKRQMKVRALNDLKNISRSDRSVSQLVNSLFEPILDFHARDAIGASSFTGPLG